MEEVGVRAALIVALFPLFQADEAKLVPADAGHMVTAFCLFDEHATGRTALPVLEVSLKVGVAGPAVPDQHALATKLRPATFASKGLSGVDDTAAVLVGAETQARIADCLLPKQKSPIALFVVLRQVQVARSRDIQHDWAILLRTSHLFHDCDLVYEVVMQTSPAKLVLALADSAHLVCLETSLAQLAHRSGEGTSHDDVLEVEFLHLFAGG